MSSLGVEVREARARTVRVTDDSLAVDLVDGRTIIVPLAWFPRLRHGLPDERDHWELSDDGAYVHWPKLDEDLSIVSLLLGWRSGESAKSLKKWSASRRKRGKSSPKRS